MELAGLVIGTAQDVLDVAEGGVVPSGSTAAAAIPRKQARPSLKTMLPKSEHLSVQATRSSSNFAKARGDAHAT
jgi:hypothetical protein